MLNPSSHKMPFDPRCLTIAYEINADDVAVQAGGWGFGNDALMDELYPEGRNQPDSNAGGGVAGGGLGRSDGDSSSAGGSAAVAGEYDDENDFSVAFTLESVADNLMGVAGSLLDSVRKE